MTVYNMNNKPMRCFGRIKHSGSKMDNEPVIILALEADGKPNHSKICFHTRIRDDSMREELIRLVQSDAVQSKPNKLWRVLQTASFSAASNRNMLDVLYGLDVIRDFPFEHLVYEGLNNTYPSIQQVLDDIRIYENTNLMDKEGVGAKLASETMERESRVNSKLNEFDNRIGKMEEMLTKLVSMQEAMLNGTSITKTSKKVLKDEPVDTKPARKPELETKIEVESETDDEFGVLPPRVC